jgi:hypothetical protein
MSDKTLNAATAATRDTREVDHTPMIEKSKPTPPFAWVTLLSTFLVSITVPMAWFCIADSKSTGAAQHDLVADYHFAGHCFCTVCHYLPFAAKKRNHRNQSATTEVSRSTALLEELPVHCPAYCLAAV